MAVSVAVALTGTMRPPEARGADGPPIATAIVAAAHPRLGPHVPVVIFPDKVDAARWVTSAARALQPRVSYG